MITLTLHRQPSTDNGTFGTLYEGYREISKTCERPDNGNQKMGCIPLGDYTAAPFQSPSKGNVFLLKDVPNRSMIEIHKGNTIDDTEGCILVGLIFGQLNGKKAVLSSATALNEMLGRYTEEFILSIVEQK